MMAGITGSEQSAILTILLGVPATGISLVVIEHVIHAAGKICEPLIVFDQGRKIMDGAASVVLQCRVVSGNMGSSQ